MNGRWAAGDQPQWDEELARLEQLIVEQRAAVAEGRYPEVTGHVLPDGLGPLPAALGARLRTVFEETVAIEQALAGQLDTMARRSIAANRAQSRLQARRPLFVDQSA